MWRAPIFSRFLIPRRERFKDTLDAVAKDLPKAKDAEPEGFSSNNSVLKSDPKARRLYRGRLWKIHNPYRFISADDHNRSWALAAEGIFGVKGPADGRLREARPACDRK